MRESTTSRPRLAYCVTKNGRRLPTRCERSAPRRRSTCEPGRERAQAVDVDLDAALDDARDEARARSSCPEAPSRRAALAFSSALRVVREDDETAARAVVVDDADEVRADLEDDAGDLGVLGRLRRRLAARRSARAPARLARASRRRPPTRLGVAARLRAQPRSEPSAARPRVGDGGSAVGRRGVGSRSRSPRRGALRRRRPRPALPRRGAARRARGSRRRPAMSISRRSKIACALPGMSMRIASSVISMILPKTMSPALTGGRSRGGPVLLLAPRLRASRAARRGFGALALRRRAALAPRRRTRSRPRRPERRALSPFLRRRRRRRFFSPARLRAPAASLGRLRPRRLSPASSRASSSSRSSPAGGSSPCGSPSTAASACAPSAPCAGAAGAAAAPCPLPGESPGVRRLARRGRMPRPMRPASGFARACPGYSW